MPIDPEAVTLPGSGLTFINYYDDSVTEAYRQAAITAEHELQSHFTNQTTIGVTFKLESLDAGSAASNGFNVTRVSFNTLTNAMRSHAVSSDDQVAVAGLPTADPSAGVGFAIADPLARILGLTPQTNSSDDHVSLNSDLAWFTSGPNGIAAAVGAIEHEITEGGFGRVASLGLQDTRWAPLDLFRFTASGVRDLTGGSDGVDTFFGIDASHISARQFHSAISAAGVDDGQDLGDWSNIRGDAFGPGGPNSPGSLSATDVQVLDVLGWNSTPFTPAADDFANILTDSQHPMGLLSPGGSATGMLQSSGDRDWFRVTLQAGTTYTFKETGHFAGGGTLADPFLRLHDAAGTVLAFNDDIVDGDNPDSSIVFTASTSGSYYVEAGAFVDGYAGSYTVSVSGGAAGVSTQPSAGDDQLQASGTLTSLDGGAGNDTITGWSGGDVLRGGDGNDVIHGGSGFDDINGNKGDDTIDGGGSGGDWLVGGQGNDLITGQGDFSILYGNLGNDTINGGSGGEWLRGGQGDDVLSGGGGNDFISGDRGNDTETGGTGADTFNGFSGIGTDKILDFHVSEGDRIQLDPGTQWTVSQVGADTVVDLGNGDKMTLVGVQMTTLPPGWIFGF